MPALEARRSDTVLRLKVAAIAGSVVILPFVVAELVNRRQFKEQFPFVLFGTLWLLAATIIAIAMPMVRAQDPAFEGAAKRATRIVLLIALVAVFGRILIDQMPCFLGVPGCD